MIRKLLKFKQNTFKYKYKQLKLKYLNLLIEFKTCKL